MNVSVHERHNPEPTMTTDLKNALLIHNPNAGGGGKGRRRTLDAARHIFAVRGIESELAETTGPGHATEIAHRAASEGRGLVITCGGDGMLVYSLDLDLKARIGMLAYWWEGAREVFRYNFQHFRIRICDQKLAASLVIVGRTKNYGGPFKITTNADLFEDQFEVMALTTQSGFRYLSYLPTLWMGNLRGTEGVHFYKSDTVICEPLDKNPLYAQVDGEPLARLPVEFKIVPRALKLLVPGSPA